jgi:hypothetical protein
VEELNERLLCAEWEVCVRMNAVFCVGFCFPEHRFKFRENNLRVVCFLMGNSPASEFYMPTFRNTICSIFIGKKVNNDNLRMVGYPYERGFGLKIA